MKQQKRKTRFTLYRGYRIEQTEHHFLVCSFGFRWISAAKTFIDKIHDNA